MSSPISKDPAFVGALDLSRPQVVILLSNGDVRDFSDWVRDLCRRGCGRFDKIAISAKIGHT